MISNIRQIYRIFIYIWTPRKGTNFNKTKTYLALPPSTKSLRKLILKANLVFFYTFLFGEIKPEQQQGSMSMALICFFTRFPTSASESPHREWCKWQAVPERVHNIYINK